MKRNATAELERQELIQKIIDAGYGDVVETFLTNEQEVYTKRGRLNKSGACRILGCSAKDLDIAFQKLRVLLRKDWE